MALVYFIITALLMYKVYSSRVCTILLRNYCVEMVNIICNYWITWVWCISYKENIIIVNTLFKCTLALVININNVYYVVMFCIDCIIL